MAQDVREITINQEKIAELVKLILRVGGVGIFVNLFKDAKITCDGKTVEINGGLAHHQVTGTYDLAGPLKEFSDEVLIKTMSLTDRDLFHKMNQPLAIGVADMEVQFAESKKNVLGFIVGMQVKDFPATNVFIVTLPKVDGEGLLSILRQNPTVILQLFNSLISGLNEASPMTKYDDYKMIVSLQKKLFGLPIPLQPQYRNKEVLTGNLTKEEENKE